QLFAEREATVWSVADGFGSVHLAVPAGRRVAGVGILRTRVTSLEKAASAFSGYVAATINLARASGLVTHSTWIRVPDPGAEATREIISIDRWMDGDAMNAYYDGRHGFDLLGPVFAGAPDTTVWTATGGDWTEW